MHNFRPRHNRQTNRHLKTNKAKVTCITQCFDVRSLFYKMTSFWSFIFFSEIKRLSYYSNFCSYIHLVLCCAGSYLRLLVILLSVILFWVDIGEILVTGKQVFSPQSNLRHICILDIGLKWHGGHGGHDLHCPWSWPWCPFKSVKYRPKDFTMEVIFVKWKWPCFFLFFYSLFLLFSMNCGEPQFYLWRQNHG